MPARSKAQQRLFGAALRHEREGGGGPAARRLSDQMSEAKLREFAGTKTENLPEKLGYAVGVCKSAEVKSSIFGGAGSALGNMFGARRPANRWSVNTSATDDIIASNPWGQQSQRASELRRSQDLANQPTNQELWRRNWGGLTAGSSLGTGRQDITKSPAMPSNWSSRVTSSGKPVADTGMPTYGLESFSQNNTAPAAGETTTPNTTRLAPAAGKAKPARGFTRPTGYAMTVGPDGTTRYVGHGMHIQHTAPDQSGNVAAHQVGYQRGGGPTTAQALGYFTGNRYGNYTPAANSDKAKV